MLGGYNQIELNGVDITVETPITITGIYNKIKNCYENNKVIIIYNLLNNGVRITPDIYRVVKDNTNYKIEFNNSTTITVAENNSVTVTIE